MYDDSSLLIHFDFDAEPTRVKDLVISLDSDFSSAVLFSIISCSRFLRFCETRKGVNERYYWHFCLYFHFLHEQIIFQQMILSNIVNSITKFESIGLYYSFQITIAIKLFVHLHAVCTFLCSFFSL